MYHYIEVHNIVCLQSRHSYFYSLSIFSFLHLFFLYPFLFVSLTSTFPLFSLSFYNLSLFNLSIVLCINFLDANPVLGWWHRVDVRCIADVSEMEATLIFETSVIYRKHLDGNITPKQDPLWHWIPVRAWNYPRPMFIFYIYLLFYLLHYILFATMYLLLPF